jgi:MerR family transcriptional regulator, copper efflux regulator
MNIGAASAASGVSAKMIRHYEAIGLLRPAARKKNSYRDYGGHDLHELRFIGRARKLGFSMDEIAALLALWRDKARPSREVKRVATRHLAELETRMAEMQTIAQTLRELVWTCLGDERPDCPILAELGGERRQTAGQLLKNNVSHAGVPARRSPKRGKIAGAARVSSS